MQGQQSHRQKWHGEGFEARSFCQPNWLPLGLQGCTGTECRKLLLVFTNLELWEATTSCKNTWDNVLYFGLNGLSMILCLWFTLLPLSKLLAMQDHAQNLEEQLWMEGREGVNVLNYLTDVWLAATWSKKGWFFVGVSQHFSTCCSRK